MTLEIFNQASTELRVHSFKDYDAIFYRGFKLVKYPDNTVSILSLKDYNKPSKRVIDFFEKLPFKYVCDMISYRNIINKLYILERNRYKNNRNQNDYKQRKAFFVEMLNKTKTTILNLD
jgi:hypothetical protein